MIVESVVDRFGSEEKAKMLFGGPNFVVLKSALGECLVVPGCSRFNVKFNRCSTAVSLCRMWPLAKPV